MQTQPQPIGTYCLPSVITLIISIIQLLFIYMIKEMAVDFYSRNPTSTDKVWILTLSQILLWISIIVNSVHLFNCLFI